MVEGFQIIQRLPRPQRGQRQQGVAGSGPLAQLQRHGGRALRNRHTRILLLPGVAAHSSEGTGLRKRVVRQPRQLQRKFGALRHAQFRFRFRWQQDHGLRMPGIRIRLQVFRLRLRQRTQQPRSAQARQDSDGVLLQRERQRGQQQRSHRVHAARVRERGVERGRSERLQRESGTSEFVMKCSSKAAK